MDWNFKVRILIPQPPSPVSRDFSHSVARNLPLVGFLCHAKSLCVPNLMIHRPPFRKSLRAFAEIPIFWRPRRRLGLIALYDGASGRHVAGRPNFLNLIESELKLMCQLGRLFLARS